MSQNPVAPPSKGTVVTSENTSFSPRPEVISRTDSHLPGHLRESNTSVPVTPGIGLGTYDDKDDGLDSLKQPQRSHSPGYFQPQSNNQAPPPVPADNLNPGDKILKRLGFAAMAGRRESLSDIRQGSPDLALSGNVISATFNFPHSLQYVRGKDWVLGPRRGQSALSDSFSYLSSDDTPWNHTVVAWTGEIETPADVLSPPETPPATTTHFQPLNSLSAPIPVDGKLPQSVAPAADGLWIPREDQLRLENQLAHDKRIKTVPVWLADDNEGPEQGVLLADQARWRRYAEQELYTLFHYIQHEPTDGRKERLQWADFYRMNQKFANRIAEIYKPGDIVVVHDYYLMLLPSMLRQRLPHMYISFFLHSPFPTSEFLRCLPRRKEILEGVLGSNLIGFQSFSYARHFASCCTRVLGFPSDHKGVDAYGARVEVDVFPIGIDATKVERLAWSDSVNEKYNALKKMYAGKKIIVGRDRLDRIRGVDKKLLAFESFLERYPEWRENVVMIQVTSPTSIEDEKAGEDVKIASKVNELVMKINGAYGSLGFSPVQHYPQYLGQDEYFALLRAGDIGLITSVRDGMNTTSLEYIVCQRDDHGPLIISEFSGTASSLREALHINPWDFSKVAEEINRALTMSAGERQKMQENLYAHARVKDVKAWVDQSLRRLVQVLAARKNVVATPLLDRSDMLTRYRAAPKRLFMFDYDGTLTPIVREPSAAVPSERVIKGLTALASDPKNVVWIISGRDQEFLTQHLGHIPGLGFSAEHGSFMRHPGTEEWINLAEQFDMAWQDEVIAIFQKYTDQTPGSFIERKRCALTWHYRLAETELGIQMARECQKALEATVARKWEVDVMPGKANLEVRPTFINKGEIAKRLVVEHTAKPEDGKLEFVMCAGDDFTDEDMFRSLNGLSAEGAALLPEQVFSITVGASTKVTLARWHLLEPEDVVECISLLSGTEPVGGVAMGEVNLAALAAVEGHLPEEVVSK